jgi:hypothetical protein
MKHKTPHPAEHRKRQKIRALTAWAATRRRAALAQALRGACYGAGTGAAGLATLWIQHRL